MDILCVTPYYKPAYIYGGPARSVPSLCEAMAKCGVRVTVFTTNANGPGKVLDIPTSEPLNVGGVIVRYFPVSWPLARIMPFFSPSLKRACDSCVTQHDVVYILGNWTHSVYAGAVSAQAKNIPYVLSPRGSLMNWSMQEKAFKKRIYFALLERRIINQAAAIHVTSSLEECQMRHWRFATPVITVPNGMDLAPFAELPLRGKFRQSLSIPPTDTLSLFVGRLHKEKRLDLIISAFAVLVQQFPNAHLLIVGPDQDGSGKTAQEQVRFLGLADRVHFSGQLTGADLVRAYVDADMLVLLSHRENFGMVAVEAMAAGLPVLLAKEVGLAEEVEQAHAGLVVDAEVHKIEVAWNGLLSDRILRKEMGQRGRKLVQERFASNVVATRMLAIFASVSNKQ